MSTIEAIVLGIVQGLTEFLPISSTAHLRIVPAFAGWGDPGAAFTAVVQLGTTVAVVLYFRRELWRVARAWLASVRRRDLAPVDLDARLGWFLIVATVPISIFGLAFQHAIETQARNLYLIAGALIVVGFGMLAAERVATRQRPLSDVRLRDAVTVGFAQALALVPGVSRSGSTISAGLLLGLERAAAARFSFLLSIPAIVLSGLFELHKLLDGSAHQTASAGAVVIATGLAFVTGYASIAFLLRYLQTHTMFAFVVYRVALGAAVLALATAGLIS
ncbi:undecaprenyl-diphosphate phosphatase [Thermoleophilum album]|uniref:Undecaprenyl-diphosphatase n=1 Tax=Thermoleophilum album TaxID=29539 RepID=A0A1H6FHB0_THEAL|nr:undecaprenyl-diphosphate phosphatase [Thermoleophilum album]SEH10196.1 undecaprenyl-diphosphatase [Thermoleophilum album]